MEEDLARRRIFWGGGWVEFGWVLHHMRQSGGHSVWGASLASGAVFVIGSPFDPRRCPLVWGEHVLL